MTTQDPGPGENPELVRFQDFEHDGPLELDISNSSGQVRIELHDGPAVHVTVRHDPDAGQGSFISGLSGLLGWVSDQLGDSITKERTNREPAADAVHQTRIDLTGNRLVVQAPSAMPLRTVPLSITVRAPSGSQIGVRTGAGDVAVAGQAARMQIQTGSGTVSVERATGSAAVRTGSGQLRLGEMTSGVQARSGSGSVEITSIAEASSVVTGTGDVWLGGVRGDVLVRSGSGDVTVAEAESGQAELISGSGQLRVAVRQGVTAEVDLTSATGEARSELEVSGEPPRTEPALRIFARTGSGDAVVTGAV